MFGPAPDSSVRALGYARPMAHFEIESTVTGVVWEIKRSPGERVEPGETVVILECMKMEVPVVSERSGTVSSITCEVGRPVSEYDVLAVLDLD